MAEALVSEVLERLASIVGQQAEESIRLIVSVDEEVGRLTRNFQAIQAVLIDAEKRQVTEAAVRGWFDKLKDISYDVDDVLDEWNTEIQKLKIKKIEEASKPLKKVCSLIAYCLCCSRKFVLRYDIAVKIRNLDRRLDIIVREKDRFQFLSNTEGTREEEEEAEGQMTTSVIDITEVHIRDEEKKTLLDLLLSQSSQGNSLHIIYIEGMKGIGKTTLARLAFNDDGVETHFDIKIWVDVSKPFNEMRIAKAIHKSLGIYSSKPVQLESLWNGISIEFYRKRFLLVLDDIWIENPRDQDVLKKILSYGNPESRILITTPMENVAEVIGTIHVMPLETLVDEEPWSMFSKIAFYGKIREESEIFKEIGEKLVEKCKGLPLAINILASLLRFKTKIEEWQHVLDSGIWEIEDLKQGLFPPLLLSYYDLPSILKKCFLYCAIFPKNYKIKQDELIKLWMAQDYLKAKNNKDMELVGEEYFNILAMRSFFRDFKKDPLDDITSFKMHDTVHDFVQFFTQNEYFIADYDGYGESEYESSSKEFRHSRLKAHGGGSFPSSIYTQKVISSLVSLREFGNVERIERIGLSKLYDELTCLRTLTLNNQDFEEIPANIKQLIHLRYLNLSKNRQLERLPETLCELLNLEILNINSCERVQKLPQGIGNLINLRCLENGKSGLMCMPKSFEKLTGLRRLDKFVISDGGYGSKVASSVGCLKNFKSLQKINIKGLGMLRGVDKAEEVELYNKKNLRVLNLGFQHWSGYGHHVRVLESFHNESANSYDAGVLEALQPPPNLEKLKIKYQNVCAVFPDWILSLTNLRELSIKRCYSCEQLFNFGKLSSLESLIIWYNQSLKRVGDDFLGIESVVTSSSSSLVFPKLKFLWFGFMEEWEEWNYEIKESGEEEIAIMPCLQTLKIDFCPKLKSLPNHLCHMTTLKREIYGCPLLEHK